MEISQQGLELLTHFEGFSSTVYPDEGGKLTIGYGHLIEPGEKFTSLTQAQGLELLKKDIQPAEKAVNSLVTVSLNQQQFDALCSFVYNVGQPAFKKSTLLTLINESKFEQAAIEILKWDHINKKVSQGLLSRRRAEAKMLYSS
jgi:lysozyme